MILFTPQQLDAMRAAAVVACPEEACGLLVGAREADDQIRVTHVAPSANLAADRRRRFDVDPALRLRLQKALRQSPRAIVGYYQSHPNGPARPSATDLARATEPDLVWVILAVENGKAGKVAAYRLAADGAGFEPLDLAIDDGARP